VLDWGLGDMPGAESKAPKPLEELNPRDGCGGTGVDFWTGLGSKKLPPLRFEVGGETWLETLPKFAKALGFDLACNGGEVGLEKLKLLNASFIPPNEDSCGCCRGTGGDCMPPNDPEDAWDGCC
jgi:hypothetical protein